MKKIITTICLLAGLAGLSAEWLPTNKGSGETPVWDEVYRVKNNAGYNLILPGVERETKNGLPLYTVKGSGFLRTEKGFPKVPAIRQMIAIPVCDSVKLVITPVSEQTYSSTIYPQGEMINDNGMLKEQFYNGYQAVYNSLNGYWPANNHTVTYSALRGQQIAEVELYPVQYTLWLL